MDVTVIGAGPAGVSAALTALGEGSQVTLYDKSPFPRHKVCGEFLSPEVAGLLDRLGVWSACERELPSVLRSVFLSIGERSKSWKLAEPARGLSRYSMDRILLKCAIERGAEFRREQVVAKDFDVVAQGRHARVTPGNRLFGFKAHFSGPADDVMSLYFFGDAYVGVNLVEGVKTNVCGVASEQSLRSCDFDINQLLQGNRPLRERVAPLQREMDWLMTGPLVFGPAQAVSHCYAAGDAASFVDPFTGSGMLGAISTGMLAGYAASHRTSLEKSRREALALLQGQHLAARVVRKAITSGWAERFLPLIPGKLLFHSTRPKKIRL